MAQTEIQRLKNELEAIKKAKQQVQDTDLKDTVATPQQAEEKASTKNGGGNPLKGALYLGHELVLGGLRSIEGISDFLVGGVTDLFGGDATAERMMENDWANYNRAKEWYEPGAGMEFAGDVASGIGGMLPAIGVSLIPGLGTAAATALSSATFGLGAAGQATSEAAKETGELGGKEWLYGTASGALETGIEMASGGIGGTKAFQTLGKNLGKTVGGRLASSFVSEGLEEVASDIVDPMLKRATGVDKEAKVDYTQLPRTFLVGGATGAVMGGADVAIRSIKAGGTNNLVASEMGQQLKEERAINNERQARGKKDLWSQKDLKRTTENLSKRLQRMEAGQREAFLNKNADIANLFNADGTVAEAAESGYNTAAYSSSLKGSESKLLYKPISEDSKASADAKRVMNTLTKLTQGKTNIVLTEESLGEAGGRKVNGLYKDGVIYLDANATDYEKALRVGTHEVVHSLENTKEFEKLGDFVADAIAKDPALQEKYDREKYREAYDALLDGEYTETTKDYQAMTEIFADFLSNEVMSNEDTMKRLIGRDKNIVLKFLDWVRNAIAKLGMTKEERATRNELEKLERLLSNALDAGTGGISLEEVERNAKAAEKAKLAKEAQKRNAETAETTEEKKNTVGKGKLATARFSTDLTFAEQVDAVLGGTDVQSSHLQVRANTPKILLDVGLSDKPMLITSVHTKTAVGKEVKNKNIHNIDVGVFKDLPKLLENPAIIMDSTKQNSIVVFVNAVDNAKNPIMCAINIQGKGFYNSVEIDANLVASVYGKDTNPIGFIEKAVNDNRVLYWDKKMSQALFEIPGLQLPDNLNRLSSNVIIRKTNSNVNSFSQNSSKKVEKTSKGRASLDVDFANQAKKYYGSTYRWNETGYILQDGTRLDLSGRNEGSGGGYRQVDHRDIFGILEDGPYGTEAMVEFMGRGNIRVIPETPGINLQVEPNAEQYRLIQDFVERVGWKEGYFSVDIDNKNGDTIETLTYEGKPSGRKVVADLKYYFKEGKAPYKSNLSAFRYSIDVDTYTEKQYNDFGWVRANDVLTARENADFRSKYAKIKSGQLKNIPKTANNEYIVAVNDRKGNTFGVDNTLVFAKGAIENYKITKVVKIDLQDETSIDIVRSEIYESKGIVDTDYFDGLLEEYNAKDFPYGTQRGRSRQGGEVGQREQNGRRTVETIGRTALDTELVKKTSDRVQTVVKDKGVVRQTISDIREGKKSVKEIWDEVTENLKYGARDKWLEMRISLTDEQAGIIQAGKNVGVNLNGEIQRARAAKAAALNMLTYKQTDFNGNVVGESLKAIFNPIQKKGKAYAEKFNEYLLHQLNVDRMSAVERGVSTENKPVFEEKVDKNFSLERIKELEKEHSSFKEAAEKVWKYSKNLLQYRVDAGLITQEMADQLNKMYPHYVPTFYENTNVGKSGASVGKSAIAVRTGIKKAKGSKGDSSIKDVSLSLSKQTESVVKAAAVNKVVTKLYDNAVAKKTFIDIEVAGKEKMTDADINYDDRTEKQNQISFWKDGEKITLDISEYVYAGFEGLGVYRKADISPLESVASNAIGEFKKLVTSANPFFTVRNAIKDFGDFWAQTKYKTLVPGASLIRWGKSLFRKAFGKNTEYRKLWDTYVAMGGFQSGYYDPDVGIYDNRGPVRKGYSYLKNLVERANNYIEQTPRFAEFVASVKAGNSYERALYDSADVTTNFARGGRLTKKLNRTLIPFLNPAVQGWSKLYRTWLDPMDKLSEKQMKELSKKRKTMLYISKYGQLLLKAIAVGVGAAALNDLLWGGLGDDDEAYANIPLNVKENNFLIRTDNGKFIKIPKGRVMAFYGIAVTRILDYLNGNEEALDAWDWFKSGWDMMSPIEAASRTIFAPIGDVIANRTWYGTPIESRTLEQSYEAKDRYDESTSSIAIAIGQAIKMSPKKIHYLIDQYTGFIGEVFLPMTTEKAESRLFAKDFDRTLTAANFVVDPEYTNNISTKYYDLKDELTYAKNSGDLTAMMVLKYLNAFDNDLAAIYKAKRDIANFNTMSEDEKKLLISTLPTISEQLDLAGKTELTDAEKRQYTNILQSLLNGTMSQLTDNVENFEDIAMNNNFADKFSKLIYSDMYNDFDESKKNYAYNKAMTYYYEVYRAKMNGTKLGYKYALYDAVGANDTCLYLAEISKIESDKDKNGETITGSRKAKVQKYIQSLKLSAQQKYILLYLAGYTPTDAGKGAVTRYLLANGYTRSEVNDIWKD